jgi:hypothetical protein
MTELFAQVDADRGKQRGLWTRRALIGVFTAIAALALWGIFGQRESETVATGGGVRMLVSVPATVRGGLYYQARIDITASTTVEHARLVLAEGWFEGMQINSIEPQAGSEESRQGRVVLTYGELQPGDRLQIWMQFQVDPTDPGRRSHAIELDDAERPLVRIDRELTVLP